MIKHIMFDLDGTLLALDLQEFIEEYMKQLGAKMKSLGYDPEASVKAVWAGTMAMLKNQGEATNHQVFWETFGTFGIGGVAQIEPQMDGFYTQEFKAIRQVLKQERNLKEMIQALQQKGYTLTLATNPIFPLVGVKERLAWIGLSLEDFGLITSYENSSFSKPSGGYYEEILQKTGFLPEESLMIGNDGVDDMSALKLGISVYLVTDILEHGDGVAWEALPHGSFAQLQDYLDQLPVLV